MRSYFILWFLLFIFIKKCQKWHENSIVLNFQDENSEFFLSITSTLIRKDFICVITLFSKFSCRIFSDMSIVCLEYESENSQYRKNHFDERKKLEVADHIILYKIHCNLKVFPLSLFFFINCANSIVPLTLSVCQFSTKDLVRHEIWNVSNLGYYIEITFQSILHKHSININK